MEDARVDELYALPGGEFVAARDALAKAVRGEGDREGAAAVKALRRPSAAAAAVNALVRAHEREAQALLEAGEGLVAAQREALAGGGAQALRAGTQAARGAVDALVGQLPGNVSAATREAVVATLHAATVDPDARAAVAAGRLEHELTASKFGGVAAEAADAEVPAPKPKPASKVRSKPESESKPAPKRDREREEAEARARAEAEARERREAEAREREDRRRRDAIRRAKEAEAAAEADVSAAEAALARVEELRTQRRTAVRDAKAALAAARKRRQRAERPPG